jgi:hypothetical protein
VALAEANLMFASHVAHLDWRLHMWTVLVHLQIPNLCVASVVATLGLGTARSSATRTCGNIWSPGSGRATSMHHLSRRRAFGRQA